MNTHRLSHTLGQHVLRRHRCLDSRIIVARPGRLVRRARPTASTMPPLLLMERGPTSESMRFTPSNDASKPSCRLSGWLMAFLGTVNSRYGLSQTMVDCARAVVNPEHPEDCAPRSTDPDTGQLVGLNGVWSFAQGMRFGPDPAGALRHRHWVRRGNPDICGNCRKPRPTKPGRWKGFCEESRCHPCKKYLNAHDSERPEIYWLFGPSGPGGTELHPYECIDVACDALRIGASLDGLPDLREPDVDVLLTTPLHEPRS